ncbi:unnamed protein product [Gadus morhua 'NCC']
MSTRPGEPGPEGDALLLGIPAVTPVCSRQRRPSLGWSLLRGGEWAHRSGLSTSLATGLQQDCSWAQSWLGHETAVAPTPPEPLTPQSPYPPGPLPPPAPTPPEPLPPRAPNPPGPYPPRALQAECWPADGLSVKNSEQSRCR